jgi:2-keto-4-pentenoate hydratase
VSSSQSPAAPASTALHGEAARQLLDAYENRTPITPLITQFPSLSVPDAYRIQQDQVAAWLTAGRRVVGHKIGLTSAAMQAQLGIDQPDYGHIMDDMVLDPSGVIDLRGFLQPRVEPEIAFVLGRDLQGPGLTLEDVQGAVDSILPALEIIDSRIADWRLTLVDTIADNASSGALVLGTEPLDVDFQNLAEVSCEFSINGTVRGTGVGSDVLGSPALAVLWLANRLGELGVGLSAGHVVLSGSFTGATVISSGDVVVASFGDAGSVSGRFA